MLFIFIYDLCLIAFAILSGISVSKIDTTDKNAKISFNITLACFIFSLLVIFLVNLMIYNKFIGIIRALYIFTFSLLILTLLSYFSAYYLEKERTSRPAYNEKKKDFLESYDNTNKEEQDLILYSFFIAVSSAIIISLITIGRLYYSEEKIEKVWIKEPVYIYADKKSKKNKKFII